MSLSKRKFWYPNKGFHFSKCAVPLLSNFKDTFIIVNYDHNYIYYDALSYSPYDTLSKWLFAVDWNVYFKASRLSALRHSALWHSAWRACLWHSIKWHLA